MAAIVEAAGGVVWRQSGKDTEVCLIYRPRYGDWSLPKGKLDAGEHSLAAAVREVDEETAVRAAPQVRLSPVRYRTRDGSPKIVRYWSMRVVAAGEFHPNKEVDKVRWLGVPAAQKLVSYPHDARVLAEFERLPSITGIVLLVRHGYAGVRGGWPGPDPVRPLDGAGHRQAAALAGVLALFEPTRLISAPPRRCLQTLAPLASATDLPVEVESVFDEAVHEKEPAAAAARLVSLAADGGVSVVCSQGMVISQTVPLLAGRGAADGRRGAAKEYATAKATGWVLPFSAGRMLGPDPIDRS